MSTDINQSSIDRSSGIAGCMPLASQEARKLSQDLENSTKNTFFLCSRLRKVLRRRHELLHSTKHVMAGLKQNVLVAKAKSASYFGLRRQPRWHTRKETHGRLLWMCQSRAFSLLLFSTSNKTCILQGQIDASISISSILL